jgi:hypothetical protein
VRAAERFEPNLLEHARYEERYQRFCRIYPLLEEFNHNYLSHPLTPSLPETGREGD